MRHIDDWLIDRVFQPLADRVAGYVSCYGIAAFLFTGFMLELDARMAVRGDYLWILVTMVWPLRPTLRAYQLDAQPLSNVMPIDRVTHVAARIFSLAIIVPGATVLFLLAKDVSDRLHEIAWMMVLPAEYFTACRRSPPKWRHAAAPSHAVMVRSAGPWA